MAKFLSELMTDKTHILDLTKSDSVSKEQKYDVLDLDCGLSSIYISHMYHKNGLWYYFKKDDNNYGYPFFIVDELMGFYLAKKRELRTVSYQISKATVKSTCGETEHYGIASINFKNDNFEYYVFNQLLNYNIPSYDNISVFKNFCINEENKQQFINHLFKLFGLDIFMLQRDRGNVNLQFQINKKTRYFDLAPIYDFSNCSPNVGMAGLGIINLIYALNELSIINLERKYPEFREELSFWLDQSMKEIWNQICDDYQFNQDCRAYEKISDYYEIKEESIKKYMKQLLKDIQK